MSVMSKHLANDLSFKLTEKTKAEASLVEKEYQRIVTEICESQVPEEIMKAFKSHCEYIETSSTAYLDSNGFSNTTVRLTRQVPAKTSSYIYPKLNNAIADKIMSAKKKSDKAYADYVDLKDEVYNMLLALRTYNNIRKELPEAAPYLPPPMSNALVINIAPLRRKLAKQLPDAPKNNMAVLVKK